AGANARCRGLLRRWSSWPVVRCAVWSTGKGQGGAPSRRYRRGDVREEPLGRPTARVGQLDRVEIANAIGLQQVRRPLEVLRIERVVTGHVAASLGRGLARPDETMEVCRSDDVPAHRV